MSKLDKFLDFLYVCHPKIMFTKEVERNGFIPLLDLHVRLTLLLFYFKHIIYVLNDNVDTYFIGGEG